MEDSGKFDVIHLLVKLTITPLKWCLGYVIRVISYDIYKYWSNNTWGTMSDFNYLFYSCLFLIRLFLLTKRSEALQLSTLSVALYHCKILTLATVGLFFFLKKGGTTKTNLGKIGENGATNISYWVECNLKMIASCQSRLPLNLHTLSFNLMQ